MKVEVATERIKAVVREGEKESVLKLLSKCYCSYTVKNKVREEREGISD